MIEEKNLELLMQNYEILKDVTHEFDFNTGCLLIHIETLKNINIELGFIDTDVYNTNKTNLQDMGLRFRDIDHKIHLLADLLHYCINDLQKTYEETQNIKETYFDIIIRATNDKGNDND